MKRCCYCLSILLTISLAPSLQAQKENKDPTLIPGGTKFPLGHVEVTPLEMGAGPECERSLIVVPENRAAEDSRNIELTFFRIKARKPSRHAPVFFLPGGPGGYHDENWVNGLKQKPAGGSNRLAWNLAEDRDVVLMNQRGARLPDRRFLFFRFLIGGNSLDQPFSHEKAAESMKQTIPGSLNHWQKMGVDLTGYDIMNMVEDINDIRKHLGYEKISFRGTSFGSQWSFSYIKQYPQHVDRALLSGVEPIDHGYDSPQGVWNAFKRLEKELEQFNGEDNRLNLPDISLTEAIEQIVARLEKEPVKFSAKHAKRNFEKEIPIGVEDFQRFLRRGINAGRETTESLEKFPKFIFEIYNEDYSFLASKVLEERASISGASMQLILIDNSLGISKARDQLLDSEEPRKWVGELNAFYKATRELTPTPVVPDSFRKMDFDIPILLVNGDMDLSTPIENAEEAMQTLANAHLIRIKGGTHGAFKQAGRTNAEFLKAVDKFMSADFESRKVADLGLPDVLQLPPLEFKPASAPSLFEEISSGNKAN